MIVPGPASRTAAANQRVPRTWPLGTFVPTYNPPSICPDGAFTCSTFEITGCPSVTEDVSGILAEADPPSGAPRGVVVMFTGANGTAFWETNQSSLAGQMVTSLYQQDGFIVVQVRWSDAWLKALPGERTGMAFLACRPATVVDQIYRTVYLPLGLTQTGGECGFCVTGRSGGASQAAYPVAFYALDGEIDGLFPTSGPTNSAMVKGCVDGYPGYTYDDLERQRADDSWGYIMPGPLGPCMLHDPSFTKQWTQQSVDTGGNDYVHPGTRVEFIIGGLDDTAAPAHAGDYRDRLEVNPKTSVTWTVVPTMAHAIQDSQDGLDALEAALTWTVP